MKIVLRKWGGFTGKAGAEVHQLDLDSLAPGEASRFKQLVQGAGFFQLPEKLSKSAPQPWDFNHSLTVEDGGKAHTVEFHQDAIPPALGKLVEELQRPSGS